MYFDLLYAMTQTKLRVIHWRTTEKFYGLDKWTGIEIVRYLYFAK
jgi:hypothetical protein